MQGVQVNGYESDWNHVTRAVPHESVFGPLLFIVCINDENSGTTIGISKFVDDTKSGRII